MQSKKHHLIPSILIWSFGLFALALLCCGLILWFKTPSVSWLISTNPQTTAMMQYKEKHTEYETPRKWKWIKISDVSPHLVHAVIIIEDHMFYEHKGFNWEMLYRALKINLKRRKIVRGGSTITQQLAKNIFLDPSTSYLRKIREAFITYQLEKTLSKKRVLELYLNVIEWGPNIFGIEAASEHYFNHSANKLNVSESIRLASILNNPNQFSPLDNTNLRINRKRLYILKGMLIIKHIDSSDYHSIKEELSLP